MIILSQDRKHIVNLNSIKEIRIDSYNSLRADIYSDYELQLGSYATEERAKEVLQEIIKIFTDEEFFHIRKSSLNNLDELAEPKYILRPASRPKVYEMPEE